MSEKQENTIWIIILLLGMFIVFKGIADSRQKSAREEFLLQKIHDSNLEINFITTGAVHFMPIGSNQLFYVESSNNGIKNKRHLGGLTNCYANKIKCYEKILENKEEIIRTGNPSKTFDIE